MWNSKRDRIADLEARLAVAQRPREGSLSAEDAAALRAELRTTRMHLAHVKEQVGEQQKAIMQLLRRLDNPPAEPRDTDAEVRAVQGWMALDLHTALGRDADHHVTAAHQGHGSWADWWADLCAEVRRGRPAADPCAHGCRDAADEHTRLSQELAAGEVAP